MDAEFKKNIDFNIEQGRKFGYPECCISSFVERLMTPNKVLAEMNKLYVRKLHGTGYVPCYVCDQTKTEDEMIAEINERRTHEGLPFPIAHSKHDKEWMAKLNKQLSSR